MRVQCVWAASLSDRRDTNNKGFERGIILVLIQKPALFACGKAEEMSMPMMLEIQGTR